MQEMVIVNEQQKKKGRCAVTVVTTVPVCSDLIIVWLCDSSYG